MAELKPELWKKIAENVKAEKVGSSLKFTCLPYECCTVNSNKLSHFMTGGLGV